MLPGLIVILPSLLLSAVFQVSGKEWKPKSLKMWQPKANKSYTLPDDELAYTNVADDRFAYLSRVFSALMTVEDVERAYIVLRRIRAWGKHQFFTVTGDRHLLEQSDSIHVSFDKFLMELRKWEESRKTNCPDMKLEMLGLARSNFSLLNSPCLDVKESAEDKVVIDKIFNMVLHKRLSEAQQDVENHLNIRQKLFKIEMVILLLRLALEGKQPCVNLWEDSWNLIPYQKFVILKAYNSALLANISPNLSEAALKAHDALKEIHGLLPHSIIGTASQIEEGIFSRIGLAIGNLDVQNRLSHDPTHSKSVAKCRAEHPPQQIIIRTVQREPIQNFRQVATPTQPRIIEEFQPQILEAARQRIIEETQPRAIEEIVTQQPITTQQPIVRYVEAPPTPAVKTVYVNKPVVEQERPVVLSQVVEKACPGPDYRLLIDVGQAYRRALHNLRQRHSIFLESEQISFDQVSNLIEQVENIARRLTRHELKFD